MATDGASCEPDFSRAAEEAARAPAEAAVTEVPGWARGSGVGAPGALCQPGLFRVRSPRGAPSWGCLIPRGRGEAAAWVGDPASFPSLAGSSPGPPGSRGSPRVASAPSPSASVGFGQG